MNDNIVQNSQNAGIMKLFPTERTIIMTHLEELQRTFINLRMGTFIHFNSASVQFNQSEIIDWEFDHENGSEPRKYPFDEKDWNPTKLDCRQWAETAKAGGARFAAYTAKHHEGFCTFPSQYTEHCVRNAANKTDVVKEYLTAFRDAGIIAGLYFSILDLTAGLGRRSCTPEQVAMVKGEITELLTNYGEIPFIMFDGWGSPWGGPSYEDLPFEDIDGLVKSLQPDCLSLCIGWTKDIAHSDICFYEGGAGQKLEGEFYGPGILCQKMTDTWFWRMTDPKTAPRSADWLVGLAENCFSKNVNFMNNISPRADGSLDENLREAFFEVGKKLTIPAPLYELPDGWMRR